MANWTRGAGAVLGGWLGLLFLGGSLAAQSGEAWHTLFDGQSLDGWRASENPGSFRVEDGEIVVKGPRAHLFYAGDVGGASFRNFIFEADVLTRASANSGVFVHTQFQAEGWPSVGYEIQVNSSHGDSIKTGSIYGVVQVNPAASVDDEWFRLRCAVRGRRITTWVNDAVQVDYLEPEGVDGTRRLSRGTIALQAHDPDSEVHYRDLRIQLLPEEVPLTRADWVAVRSGEWYERMDVGPFLTSIVGIDPDDDVLKGITVELGPERRASVIFDTDLLRMAAGWEGYLRLRGTPYDGSHGAQPTLDGPPLFHVTNGPGWESEQGFTDPRSTPHGPIPDAHGRYRGLYRSGEHVVFDYEVAGMAVLEMPSRETLGGHSVITRTFEVGPSDRRQRMVLADEPGRSIESPPGGRLLLSSSAFTEEAIDDRRSTVVLVDRGPGSFEDLAMGLPAGDDDLDAARGPGVLRFVATIGKPHPGAGAEGETLPRLNDGAAPQNHDDTARTSWFDGPHARVVADLGSVQEVLRVNTFSWHRSNRAPQHFTLWGAATPGSADPAAPDLAEAGWVRLAEIDSRALGEGGCHGSTVSNRAAGLGRFQRLLWDLRPLSGDEGLFLGEIDVYTREGSREVPALKAPLAIGEHRSLAAVLRGHPRGVTLQREGERMLLVLEPSADTRRFEVSLVRGVGTAEAEELSARSPAFTDLPAYCRGGPTLWPDRIHLPGQQATGADSYLVDDVPLPFENPWLCSLRVGGFDFFPDGDRAALCTWNGDVWVVSGLRGEWDDLVWKRFAGGLFETLGLCIQDGRVLVNGRDQITRLHDLDGDGEADYYESFNNDVQTTRNFHEFSFDLQTDAEGNFYFSKAGPVKGGGRGFDEVAAHNGTVLKLSADGKKLEVYATGMRAPNGIGVSQTGQITAGDNEGTWVPRCKLHWLHPGSFQGVKDTAPRGERPTSYNPPLCFFPMEVDNSGGGQVWVTSDRWGPMQGDLLHLSYGKSSIYRVLYEEQGSLAQGGVVRIPVQLGSSGMRGRFHPTDGQLYVCGLRGWQTNAARLSAFQRIRYSGKPLPGPRSLRVRADGLEIGFETPLDRELAEDIESWSVEVWNYVWGPQYGSPEVSALHPDPEIESKALETEMHDYKKHDALKVHGARLSADGRTVFLAIEGIAPVMQMNVRGDLETASGELLSVDLYNTIHWLGEGSGSDP